MKSGINDKWSKISRKLSGETQDEDDSFFEDWIIHNDNKELYETIERIKLDCDYETAMEIKEQVFEETFNKIFSQKQIKRNKSHRMTYFLSIAATIALIVGCFSIYYYYDSIKQHESMVVFSCPTGISKIVLPDSTVVTLNTGTTITYASNNFNKKYRSVTLNGEAFFDVKHDSKRPFIVSTEKIDVKVLGTVFNVNAYSNNENVTTSLISGSVELTEKTNNKKMKLAPGQASTYSKRTTMMNLYNFDTNHIKDWMYFIFNKESFQSICHKLEQRFGSQIELRNVKIEDKQFTGKFSNNDSLTDILDIIKINVPFSYRIEEEKIIIY